MQIDLYLDFMRLTQDQSEAVVSSICGCRQAKILRIAGSPNNFFTTLLFQRLADHKSLEQLDIFIEWLDQSSFIALSDCLWKNASIQKLCLRFCDVSNTDMEVLVRGLNMNPEKKLRSILLHDCRLLKQGIKPLTSYLRQIDPAQFEEIHLSFLENIDANDFGMMLRSNTSLKKVSVCSLKYEGQVESITNALEQHEKLEEFVVNGVKITVQMIIDIGNACVRTKLKKLVLDSCTISAIQDFAMVKFSNSLAATDNLEYIDLSGLNTSNLHLAF